MRKLCLLLALLGIVALACGTTTVVTPTTDVNAVVAQTLAAYTVEALLTQAAISSETPSVTPSLTPPPPTDTHTPTSIPEEVAPDPLPVAYTGRYPEQRRVLQC